MKASAMNAVILITCSLVFIGGAIAAAIAALAVEATNPVLSWAFVGVQLGSILCAIASARAAERLI